MKTVVNKQNRHRLVEKTVTMTISWSRGHGNKMNLVASKMELQRNFHNATAERKHISAFLESNAQIRTPSADIQNRPRCKCNEKKSFGDEQLYCMGWQVIIRHLRKIRYRWRQARNVWSICLAWFEWHTHIDHRLSSKQCNGLHVLSSLQARTENRVYILIALRAISCSNISVRWDRSKPPTVDIIREHVSVVLHIKWEPMYIAYEWRQLLTLKESGFIKRIEQWRAVKEGIITIPGTSLKSSRQWRWEDRCTNDVSRRSLLSFKNKWINLLEISLHICIYGWVFQKKYQGKARQSWVVCSSIQEYRHILDGHQKLILQILSPPRT